MDMKNVPPQRIEIAKVDGVGFFWVKHDDVWEECQYSRMRYGTRELAREYGERAAKELGWPLWDPEFDYGYECFEKGREMDPGWTGLVTRGWLAARHDSLAEKEQRFNDGCGKFFSSCSFDPSWDKDTKRGWREAAAWFEQEIAEEQSEQYDRDTQWMG